MGTGRLRGSPRRLIHLRLRRGQHNLRQLLARLGMIADTLTAVAIFLTVVVLTAAVLTDIGK